LDPDRAVIFPTFIKKVFLSLDDDFFGLFNSKKTDFFYQRSFDDYFTADLKKGPGLNCYL
jgi:hypothetical protein